MTAPARTQPAVPEDADPDPRRWRVLVVCLVAGFMTLLDVSIVNVALPSIRTGLGAGENAVQWVVSGYALAFGLLLVPAGRIGDARGRRPTFMVGLAGFTLASVACGLAPSPTLLVVARLIQGTAGGILLPQVSGLIQQLFQGEERGRAFGALGATIGISTAVGPLLGGLIIAGFGADTGWRIVFFVNAPVGAAALVLAARLLPRPAPREGTRQDLDPVGVVLLGLAVTALLVPLIEQQTWHSPLRLALYPVALVLFLAWYVHERRYSRRGTSVVDLDLFTRRSYSLGAGIGILYFAGFTGIFFTYAQYLQEGDVHYTALQSGLAVTPFALGSAVTAFVGGRVVLRFGRPLVAVGLGLVTVGLLATYAAAQAVPGSNVGWATAVPLLVAGVGSGFVISPNQTLTLSEVPVRRAGSAGGVLQTGQRIGAAAGIAATGSVFFSAVASSRGDFGLAFRHGLWVIVGFVVLALLLAVVDVVTDRHRGGHTG